MGLLSMRNVSLRFGGIVALDDVSLEVEEGTIAGLIGPNGAGKTTAFNVITRLYRLDSGDVVFDGHSLLRTPASGVIRHGIARTFQNVELFPTMTVLENVLVGDARALALQVGARDAAERTRRPRLRRHRRRREPARHRTAVRDAQAGRAGAGARVAAAAAPPRRAGRRAQPRGGRRARRVHQAAPRRAEGDRAARRAPHEPRDERVRPRARPELRPHDRERPAVGGPARPGR